MVYVARNPKDVIVSYYFHHKLIKIHGFDGTLEEFAEYFINDEGTCCILIIDFAINRLSIK